jgi:hypothetical protein
MDDLSPGWFSAGDGQAAYIFDDGSMAGYRLNDPTMNVFSRDIGSTVWVDDPTTAAGQQMAPFSWVDQREQARMQAAYPQNGQGWDANAAMLGVSRLIDSLSKGYAVSKGILPASGAGASGATLAIGRTRNGVYASGGMLPLLLIAAGLFLFASGKK